MRDQDRRGNICHRPLLQSLKSQDRQTTVKQLQAWWVKLMLLTYPCSWNRICGHRAEIVPLLVFMCIGFETTVNHCLSNSASGYTLDGAEQQKKSLFFRCIKTVSCHIHLQDTLTTNITGTTMENWRWEFNVQEFYIFKKHCSCNKTFPDIDCTLSIHIALIDFNLVLIFI